KGTGITCKINIKSIDGNALKTPIRSIAYINGTEYTLSPGDSITATANIELVKNTRDFAGFAYYKTRYIDATAFIKSDKPIKTNKSGEFRFKYIPEYISNAIQKKLDLMLPKDEAAFVKALVVGERSDMSVSSQEDLRIVGLTHIVSVSGMHVAFLAFFIILLVGKRRAPFIVLPILVLFTLVVGGTPAIIRALIMQAIILLAPIFRREADGPTTLMFSLFIILMLNPYAACDIGLQLSFLSTLGLMLFSGRINRNLMARITIKNRFLRKIIGVSVSTFAASTSAILFTVPLIAYIFHEVSLISPIANVLILWLINGAFLVSVIAVSVSFIWLGLAKVIISPAYLMCKGALWSSSLLADVPFASVYVGNIYAVLLILYLYVILFLLYKFRREKGIPLIPICCVVLAISVTAVCIVQSQMLGDGIRLSILDVGQGQCVIGEGHGATVMIDCGGSRDKNSGDIAREYLRHVGVSSLDALILTHVHTDHTNGVVRFMQKFKVTDLYLP
ncbi:MAG: ComEC/Rec2 family competence protein, partial [Clostridia bacterium]